MRTRLEIIQNEIFKDLPTIGRQRFFACAWDSAGREIVIPCRDKNEALRKRELLQEMLELQEEALAVDFEPDFIA